MQQIRHVADLILLKPHNRKSINNIDATELYYRRFPGGKDNGEYDAIKGFKMIKLWTQKPYRTG